MGIFDLLWIALILGALAAALVARVIPNIDR
jgi:hypothetical protein